MASHDRKKKQQLKEHRHWCTQCEKENYSSPTPPNVPTPIMRDCQFVTTRDLKPAKKFPVDFWTDDHATTAADLAHFNFLNRVFNLGEGRRESVWDRYKKVANRLVEKFNFTLFNRK